MALELSIRTVDRVHQAEIQVDESVSLADILAEAQRQWKLPASADYAIRNAATDKQLSLRNTLSQAGIRSGEVLEILPLYEAGYANSATETA